MDALASGLGLETSGREMEAHKLHSAEGSACTQWCSQCVPGLGLRPILMLMVWSLKLHDSGGVASDPVFLALSDILMK